MIMSGIEVVADVDALTSVSENIKRYTSSCHASIEESIRSIQANNSDWNDEDFDKLLSAVSSFIKDIENLEKGAGQLIKRIENKISAIEQLHSMKI